MATQSSILPWKIPWIEEPLVGFSPQGCKESEVTEHACTNKDKVLGRDVGPRLLSFWLPSISMLHS